MVNPTESVVQHFIEKHDKTITKVLFIILTTIIMGGSFFLALPIGLLVYPLICRPFGCAQETALNLFGIFSMGGAIGVGALCLHALAEVKWLKSIEATSISFAIVFLTVSIAGGILQQDMPAGSLGLEDLLLAVLLIWTTLGLEWLKQWSHFAAILFFIIYIVSFPLIMNGPVKNAHAEYESQKGLSQAKTLPFQVYSPTFVPHGFWLARVNTTPAAGNLPTSYKLDYSNGTKDAPFGPGISSLTIIEEARAGEENNSSKCLSIGQIANALPCQSLGKGVYYTKFPDDPDYATVYKEVGSTLLYISLPTGVSTDEILQIFDSFRPGVARP